jgi:hypothetical protein
MKNLVLDDNLRSKIGDLKEGVEVRDEKGRVIGFMLPSSIVYQLIEAPPMSDEEMERRFAEPGGKTLAEIKQQLGME